MFRVSPNQIALTSSLMMSGPNSSNLNPLNYQVLRQCWSLNTSCRRSQKQFPSLTRCSAIAERPRCRVHYSFGQKWKTGTRRQLAKSERLELGDNIYGHYRSIFNHCDPICLKISNLKTQNKGYYGVQGHSRSSRSVTIESPYATSY